MKTFSVPIAAPFVSVGRIDRNQRELPTRKTVGSGMIRLVWNSSPTAFRSGNTSPVVGSVSAGALPALSCQVWKCIISLRPMLSRTRSTSASVTR